MYCASSYAFPGQMAPHLYRVGKSVPLMPMEDAFVTGILATQLAYPRKDDTRFAFPYSKKIECGLVNILVSGELSAKEMDQNWQTAVESPRCRQLMNGT